MREAKAVKQETIAQLTTMSGAQISRIENGKRRATRSFVEIVDDHLDAGGSLINLWEDLNKDGHPVPIWFDWPQIEADAAILVCYEHSVIPAWRKPRLTHWRSCAVTKRPPTLGSNARPSSPRTAESLLWPYCC
ncbi:helix-turn-helix domain-containing protein [Actinomadura madurae]|nr:helix-turn-helix domain-containing protein [Actinomadura madurae]